MHPQLTKEMSKDLVSTKGNVLKLSKGLSEELSLRRSKSYSAVVKEDEAAMHAFAPSPSASILSVPRRVVPTECVSCSSAPAAGLGYYEEEEAHATMPWGGLHEGADAPEEAAAHMAFSNEKEDTNVYV